MPSLVGCIKKAGGLIDAEDKAALLARAKELRASGVEVSDAARQAVRERLTHLDGLKADESPALLVRLPGSEENLTVPVALERAKAQAAEIAEEAGWMQAALDCALSG